MACVIFFLRAHVQNNQIVAAVNPLFRLVGRDFMVFSIRIRSGRGLRHVRRTGNKQHACEQYRRENGEFFHRKHRLSFVQEDFATS